MLAFQFDDLWAKFAERQARDYKEACIPPTSCFNFQFSIINFQLFICFKKQTNAINPPSDFHLTLPLQMEAKVSFENNNS